MNNPSTHTQPPASLAISSHRAAQNLEAGHDVVIEAEILGGDPEDMFAVIKYRRADMPAWSEVPMHLATGGHWHGKFPVAPGDFYYKIEAWVDGFKSWSRGLRENLDAGQIIPAGTLQAGIPLIEAVKDHATALDAERLQGWADELRSGNAATGASLTQRALDESLSDLMAGLAACQPGRHLTATSENELHISAPAP